MNCVTCNEIWSSFLLCNSLLPGTLQSFIPRSFAVELLVVALWWQGANEVNSIPFCTFKKKQCFQAPSPRIGGAIPAPYIALYLPNVTVAAMPFYVMGSMAGEYLLSNRRKKIIFFSSFVPNFYFRPSYRRPSHSAASRDPWVKVGFSKVFFFRVVWFAI